MQPSAAIAAAPLGPGGRKRYTLPASEPGACGLDWNGSILTLISLRSFSSVWFWIVLAMCWSVISHNPLGVPFDMVLRARRQGGQAMQDLETMVALQLRRRQAILSATGIVAVGATATVLTAMAVLGFRYGMELAQALTLLLVPLTLVGLLRIRLMNRLLTEGALGETLCKRLSWHRTGVQALGLLAILITALWGMWFNLNIRALGG